MLKQAQGSCSLRLMQPTDLHDVLRIERDSYDFPWTEGNFTDCFKANYHCLVAQESGVTIGYGVFQFAAQEAHILNVCIAAAFRGHGRTGDFSGGQGQQQCGDTAL